MPKAGWITGNSETTKTIAPPVMNPRQTWSVAPFAGNSRHQTDIASRSSSGTGTNSSSTG